MCNWLAMAYVLGDVGRPGGYVMRNHGTISLLQAVAMAQGVNRTAAKKHARLIRKERFRSARSHP